MKKAIAISFLMLANIILLAHTIVPHHHHENEVICFFVSHCNECKVGQNYAQYNIPNLLCENERNPSEKCCIIDNVYVPTHSHTIKSTFCYIHSKCNYGQIFEMLISNSFNIQDSVDNTLITFQQKPYTVSYHTDFISQSLGLRAPPSFI